MKSSSARNSAKTNFKGLKSTAGKIRLLLLASFTLIAVTSAVAFSSISAASSITEFLFSNLSASAEQVKSAFHQGKTEKVVKPSQALAFNGAGKEMKKARQEHTATRLRDGRVLLVGGDKTGTAEIFDPATGASIETGSLTTARAGHTATLLNDGRVLIVGGFDNGKALASTEIYDAGAFLAGPTLKSGRAGHTATVLADGRILIVGGDSKGSIEIIDAAARTSQIVTARLNDARSFHSAALLKNGNVLIVGGETNNGKPALSGEVLNLETMQFSRVNSSLHSARVRSALRRLPDGKIQIIGGNDEGSMEIFAPDANRFSGYAHVIPGRNPATSSAFKIRAAQTEFYGVAEESGATATESEVLRTETGLALLNNGEATDSLLNRSDFAVVNIPETNQIFVTGGENSKGETLNTSMLLSTSEATITTDKLDYPPGALVTITGTNFQPAEQVKLKLVRDPVFPDPNMQGIELTATADADGNFVNTEYSTTIDDLNTSFVLTAVGQESGRTAQTAFTDAGITSTAVGGEWSKTSTWTGGVVPSAADTVTIVGGSTVTVDTDSAVCAGLNLTPSSNNTTATLNFKNGVTAILTVGGSITIGNSTGSNRNGALDMSNGGTLKTSGALTINTGAFTAGAGTVEYNGIGSSQNQTITATIYNNLAMSGNSTKTAGGALTVNNDLTIGSGTTFAAGANLSHIVGGNWTNNGAFSFTTASTITFSGSTSKTISGNSSTAFNNLIVSKGTNTTSVLEVTSPMMMTGQLTLTNGLLKLTNASATAQFNASQTIAATAGIWINGGTLNGGSGSITNNGLVKVTSGTANFGTGNGSSLTTTSTGTLEIGGGTTNVSGRVNVSGGTANILAGTLTTSTIGLNTASNAAFELSATSNFSMTGGTVVFQNANASTGGDLKIIGGSGTKTITGGTFQIGNASTPAASQMKIDSAIAINNLAINSTNASATLSQNLTVNGTLNLLGSNIVTNANTLIISSTGSLTRTSGYVVGALQRSIAAANYQGNPLVWAVGTASGYNPVEITFPNVNTAGTFTVRANAGDHAQIGTSSLNSAKSVNVNWTFANGGLTFSGNSKVIFNFNASDLDAGTNTNNLVVGKYDAPNWSYPSVGARTATSTEIQGISSFSDFQLAETNCTAPIVTNPTDQTITYGSSATFTASATGSPTPGLQWQMSVNNGASWTDVSGATSALLTVAAPSVSQSGTQYRAVFNNTCGSANSSAAVLTVNRKSLTSNVTANSKVYDGNTNATIATRFFGAGEVVGTDDVTLTGGTATFDTKNVGTGKTVTASGLTLSGAAAGNYVLSSNTAATTANITKATLTVTAEDKSREYGDANPSFSVSFGGFVGGETLATSGVAGNPNCTTTATATSPASPPTYPISCTTGSLTAANYSFGFTNGNLTVTKATLTVSAANASREYGDANPTFAPQYSSFKNGETAAALTNAPTCTSAANAASPASPPTYAIVCAGGAAGNYNFNYVNGALTVTKATLTVSANNKSREYGDANPIFDGTVTGIKNGDSITATYATTATAGSAVGSYSIVPTLVDPSSKAGNYKITSNNGTLTVTAAVLTVTANDKSRAYGAANPAFDVMISGLKNGDTTAVVTTAPSCTTTATADSAAGNYPITCSAAAAANYTFSYVAGKLVVTKANLTVRADNLSRSYGAANPTLTYSLSGFVNSENESNAGVTGAPSLTTTATGTSAVGNYAITVTVGTLAAPNYNFLTANGNLEIKAAILIVSADNQSKNYGDANPTLTYSISGFANSENAATAGITGNAIISTTAAIGSAVGSYPITVDSVGTLTAANYSFAASATNGLLTVNTRTVTVTANALNKNYGEADPPLTYAVTSGSLVMGDSFSGALSRAAGESVGTYAVNQGTLVLNANYALNFAGANLTINARAITVTAEAKTKNYGDADPSLTYQITNGLLVNGDNFTGALSRASGEAVGTYAIGQGTLALSANYAVTFVGANLVVTARAITVTADAQSKSYGDGDPALTYKITGGSLVTGDGFTGALSRTAGESVGTYPILQGTLALNGNYTLNFVAANLTVNARAIAVAADAKSKVYGDGDPALTYKITGGSLAAGDSFTGGLMREAGESVGTYVIQKGTLALNSNYTLSFNSSTLTISARAITVTANAKSKTYGEADPNLTYQITSGSLAAGDNFTGNLTRIAGEDFGQYDIQKGTLALNGNYNLTFNGAKLTIFKRGIKVTVVANQGKIYGQADPTLNVVVTGTLVSGDSFSGSVSRASGENVGTYAVTQGTLSLNGNYDLTFEGANFAITARAVTVTADAKSKIYGATDPTLTYQITGGSLAFSDAFTGNLTRATGEAAGDYAIQQGSLSAGTNYALTFIAANLTITKREITVAADPKTKVYGTTDPTLTYQLTSGALVTGDSFSGALTRAAGETVGSYAINQGTLSAGGNYNLKFAGASLTITKAMLTVTANSMNRYYGNSNPPLTAAITGFKNGETLATSSVTGSPNLTTAATGPLGSAVGSYSITAALGSLAASNYDFSFVGGTLTVMADPTAITLDNTTSGAVFDCENNKYKATLKDTITGAGLAGINLKLTIGAQTATATTGSDGTATFTLTLTQAPTTSATESVALDQTWNEANRVAPPTAAKTSFMIKANTNVGPGRDATSLYTGSLWFWTTSSTSSTATLNLSATVKNVGECNGDITKANVSFLISTNGSTFSPVSGAQNLPVGRVDPNDPNTGAASAIAQYNIGSSQSVTLTVRVIVGGYYNLNTSTYDLPITIGKAGQTNSLMGGGMVNNNKSPFPASGYLGVDSVSGAFGSQVTYNKSGTNPQGQVQVYINSYNRPDGTLDTVIHSYFIKSNSISELSQISGSASFGAKTNVSETLSDGTKTSLDGGGTMQIVFTPQGKPIPSNMFVSAGTSFSNASGICTNQQGCMSIILYKSGGGVWYSSSWGQGAGTTAPHTYLKAVLPGGNIVVQ